MDATTPSTERTQPEGRRLLGPDIRRRPSGEAPPLPRELGRSGKFWLFMAAYLVATVVGVLLFEPSERLFERVDTAILRWFASWRSAAVVDVMTVVALLTSRWVIRAIRWGTIAALLVVRRWRHLVVLLAALIAEGVLTSDSCWPCTAPDRSTS